MELKVQSMGKVFEVCNQKSFRKTYPNVTELHCKFIKVEGHNIPTVGLNFYSNKMNRITHCKVNRLNSTLPWLLNWMRQLEPKVAK